MAIDDLVDRMARAIHERYLAEQARDGVAMGATTAMARWDELDGDLKEANRDQARDIAAKLAKIHCTVAGPESALRASAGSASAGFASTGSASAGSASTGSASAGFAFTDAEVDLLARAEQQRWTRQRIAAGWAYGPVRDDGAKHHPSLVSWDQLPESERDKDRDAVRHIPAVLAEAGLRVVRPAPRRS